MAHAYHPSQHHTWAKSPKRLQLVPTPICRRMQETCHRCMGFRLIKNKMFKLHVYLISVHGDMMVIKYIMNFKGPNGKSPCCTCHITRVQDTLQTQTPFCVPLTPPHDQHIGLISYDPHNLPLRSNNTYRTQLTNIQNAHSTGS